MGLTKSIINSFVSGHISPELYGRFDIAQYQNAVKQIKNFEILNSGAIRKRAGTKVVANATGYNAVVARNFSFGAIEYTFEFGVGKVTDTTVSPTVDYAKVYVKIYDNTFNLLTTQNMVYQEKLYNDTTIATVTNLIIKLNFTTIGDLLLIYSGQHPIQQIIRTSATTFEIKEYPIRMPSIIETQDKGIFFVKKTVGVEDKIVVVFEDKITQDNIGKQLNMDWTQLYQQFNQYTTASVYSPVFLYSGQWKLATRGDNWTGKIQIQTSTDKARWETIAEYDNTHDSNTNYNTEQNDTTDLMWIRLNYVQQGGGVHLVFTVNKFNYTVSGTIGERTTIVEGTSGDQFLFTITSPNLVDIKDKIVDPVLSNPTALPVMIVPQMEGLTEPSGKLEIRYQKDEAYYEQLPIPPCEFGKDITADTPSLWRAIGHTYNDSVYIITKDLNQSVIKNKKYTFYICIDIKFSQTMNFNQILKGGRMYMTSIHENYSNVNSQLRYSIIGYLDNKITFKTTYNENIPGSRVLSFGTEASPTTEINVYCDMVRWCWYFYSNNDSNKVPFLDLRIHYLYLKGLIPESQYINYKWEIIDDIKQGYPTDGVFFNGRHVIMHQVRSINRLSLSKIGEYNNFSNEVNVVEDDSPISVILDYNASESLGLLVDRYIYAFTSNGIFVMGADNQIVTPSSFKILYQRKINLYPLKPAQNQNGIYFLDTDYNLNTVQYDYSTDNLVVMPLSLFFGDLLNQKPIQRIEGYGDKILIIYENKIVYVNWLSQQQILSVYSKELKHPIQDISYSPQNTTTLLLSDDKILLEQKYADNRFLDYYIEKPLNPSALPYYEEFDLSTFPASGGVVSILYTTDGENYFQTEAVGGSVVKFNKRDAPYLPPFIHAIAGYNYEALVELLPPINEEIINQKGKVKKASIQLLDTRGLEVSQDNSRWTAIVGRGNETFGKEDKGFSGYYDVNVFSSSSVQKTLKLRNTLPVKSCILNIVNTVEFGDK